MTDGKWRIWQPGSDGRSHRDDIPVFQQQDGTLTPHVDVGDVHIRVVYDHGQITYYPWANIVRAEYDPPTNP